MKWRRRKAQPAFIAEVEFWHFAVQSPVQIDLFVKS